MFNLFKPFDLFKIGSSGSTYSPLINYDLSTTTTSGLRYLKDIGSTPTYNASMYFGRGAYFNGVDQSIDYGTLAKTSAEVSMVFRGTSVICCHRYNLWVKKTSLQYYLTDWQTLVTEPLFLDSTKTYTLNITPTLIELFENGVKILTKVPQSLLSGGARTIGTRSTDYISSIVKDVYMFNRTLTQTEITQAHEQPEVFYAMAQADSTCVLNMPMCETSSTVRNYKTGIDYPITNYTTSVRDNAKNLQYGLQTCKFVRDGLGVIQSASNYLECDGAGYATIPSHTNKVNIKMTVNPTSLSGNLLSGGVTKTLTGLTLNIDNDVVMSNVTPTGAITLASGFTGTIKSYMEETR